MSSQILGNVGHGRQHHSVRTHQPNAHRARRPAARLALAASTLAASTLAAAVLAASSAYAQTVYTYDPATTSNAWLQSGNWTTGPAGTFPGVSLSPAVTANGTSTDVALIGSNSFSGNNLGINFNTGTGTGTPGDNGQAAGQLSLGAIVYLGANSTAKALTVGKSDATASAVLRLNGATYNVGPTGGSIANLILANADGSNENLNINNAAGGSGTLTLALGSPASNIYVTAGRSLSIQAGISEVASGSTLTKLGAGTLTISTPAAFTGGFTAQAGTTNFTGNLSFGGGLSVNNAGTFVQFTSASSNTITGGINVTAGQLTLNSPTSAPSGGVRVSGGTLLVQNVNNAINGGITVSGTGTVTMSSTTHSFTGGLTVLGGTASMSGTSTTFSGGVKLSAGSLTMNAATQGFTGGIAVSGGTFTMTSTNQQYAGGITVSGGTATVSGTTSGFSGGLTVAGGSLSVSTTTQAFSGGVTVTGGTLSMTGSTASFAGGVRVSGGTLSLAPSSANSAWTGGLTVSSTGTVNLNTANALAPAAATPNTLVIDGGTLDQTGSSTTISLPSPVRVNAPFTFGGTKNLTLSGTTTLTGSSTLTTANAGTLAFTGVVVDGATPGALTKSGPGVLSLGGSSTFSGGFTLNSGVVNIASNSTGAAGAVLSGPTGKGTVTLNGGTLTTSNADVAAPTFFINGDVQIGVSAGSGRLGLSGDLDLGGATRTLTLAKATTPTLQAPGLRLITVANAPAPRLLNGSLRFTTPASFAATDYAAVNFSAASSYVDNAGLIIGPKVITTFSTSFAFGTVPALMPSVTVEPGGYLNIADTGNARNPQIYSLSGAGTVTNLANNVTPTNGNVATLQILTAGSAQFDGLLRDGTELAASLGIAAVNGTLALTMNGTGSQTLAGSNTYSGPTSLGSGTLVATNLANAGLPSSIGRGATPAGMLFLRGGTLQYTGPAVAVDRLFHLTASGGGLDASGSGPLFLLSSADVPTAETYPRTYTLAAGSNTIAGVDTTGVAIGQEITGPGIPAGTTVTTVTAAGVLGTLTLSGSIAAASTSTVTFNSTSTNDRTFTLAGASLLANTFSPRLTDALNGRTALTKAGAGTWTLATPQAFTGPTTVDAGTLRLAPGASLASTVVTVSPAGTFDPTPAFPATYPLPAGKVLVLNGTLVGSLTGPGEVRYNAATDNTIPNTIAGAASFAKPAGNGTVTFTGAVDFSGGFTLSNGAAVFAASSSLTLQNASVFSNSALDVSALPSGLVIGAANTLTMNGPITGTVHNAGLLTISTTADRTYPAHLTGPGSLLRTDGAGTSTLTGSLSYTGNTTVTAGQLILKSPLRLSSPSSGPGPVTGSLVVTGPGSSVVFDAAAYASPAGYAAVADFASVSLGLADQTGTSSLALTPVNRAAAKNAVLVTSSLSIASTAGALNGLIDLANNDLIVRNASAATLSSYVAAFLAGGPTPVGLGSSSISPAAAPYTTLAVFPNAAAPGVSYFETYDGVPLAPADVIVKYTYVGDLDLSGTLDGADLARAIEGFSTGATGWANGDVDHSGGPVSLADVLAVRTALDWYATPANNAPSLGNGTGSAATPSGAVPEPTSLALLLPAAPLLTRRRR